MSALAQYRIELEGPDAIEPFIRQYVLDAIDRVPEYEPGRFLTFAPAGTTEADSVTVGYHGDPEIVFENERPHLEALQEDGPVTGWTVAYEFDYDEKESMMGEQSAALQHQIGSLTAKMAKLAYEEFDTFPEAVDTYPEETADLAPSGWWAILHTLTVQANYSLDEELDAYLYGIKHTLRNFGEYHGEEAVDQRIDDLTDAIEGMREEVKDGRLEP